MKNFCKALILSLALTTPALAQNVQATTVNYGGGNIVRETSGNGAPSDSCTGLLRYTQNDAPDGKNIWQCVSGHMKQQGSTSSGGSGTDPDSDGIPYWDGSAWRVATFTDLQTLLSTDTSHNSEIYGSQAAGGSDVVGQAPAANHGAFVYKNNEWELSDNGDTLGRVIRLTDIPVMHASGTGHATGFVPDPGASAGTSRYLREDGTWSTPSGGSGGNIMVVPRDVSFHMAVATPGSSRYVGLGASWYWDIGSSAIAWNTAPDNGGNISGSLNTGTTVNTAVGWSSSRDVLARNPSFRIIGGVSSALGVDAWVVLSDQSSFYSTLDPGKTLGIGMVGFRYFAGTDTNWACYSSAESVYDSNTYDSGVAVSTTQQQVFDVVFTAQAPKFYIDGNQVCAGMTLTNVLDSADFLSAFFSVQNTTTTSVTASNYEAYYGSN